jgi:hypothetical protein
MKNVFAFALVVSLAGVAAGAQAPVPPDQKIASASSDLENAKKLARDEKYNEAIARIEEAIRKIKEVRDTPVGQPDLVPIAINGDGNRVVVTVQNQGNADLIIRNPQTQQKHFGGFNVRILNGNTKQPFDQHRPLAGSFQGSLPPGQTAQVQIGPITGCGGQNQPILAEVSTASKESNTNNNRFPQPFTVRGGPCGS